MNWNRLKGSKFEGGMSFWDVEAFNTTMLAKKLWCVLSRPHTLVATILKEKYFKDEIAMEAKTKRHSSFAWNSILAARDLLNQGSI